MDLFLEVGIVIILAALFSYIARIGKQPLIPAYIIAGVIIGQVFGGLNTDIIFKLSEIGIAFLLFIVGLELNFKKIKSIGGLSSVAGTIQVAVIFLLGFLATHFLGFNRIESIYLGIMIAFSSTMIVVKILSDKKELDTLHGRLIIGILVIQDILAIFAITALTSTQELTLLYVTSLLLKGLLIFGIALISSKYLLPKVFEFAARSQELLLIMSLSICFLFSLLLKTAGYSIAIGAFIGGITLASLPYNIEIIGRVRSLRDFFAVLFFTSLGLQLKLGGIQKYALPIIILTAIVIIIKPMIVTFITAFYGYSRKTTFEAGLNLAQISEFSLIIISEGVMLGQISSDLLSMTIFIAILTIAGTAYMVKYEDKLYSLFSRFIPEFKRKFSNSHVHSFADIKLHKNYDIVLCGHDRTGYSILNTLRQQGRKVFVVDFNPDVIKSLSDNNIPCMYGDMCDTEVLERLNFNTVKLVVSTANKFEDNAVLLKNIKRENRGVPVFVTANRIDEALELYNIGADYVILPHFLGGNYVSLILDEINNDNSKIHLRKYKHIEELIKRKQMGHYHPVHI